MIKQYLLAFLAFLCTFGIVRAQTTTTATFTSGNISTDFFTGTVTTSMNSGCPGTLTVPVPTGRYVTSIDVEYDFEALGINWRSEQSSYLECVTTSTKEASVSFGPAINSAGVQSYSRTGLNIANGVVPAGGLQFKLHAWRSFTTGGCGITAQRILNNTFKITVTHIAAPTCLPPTAVTVNSVTATSANVGWTTGGATNWQIEYGPPGFTAGSGTKVAATTNPFTITGLSPSTRYDFRVRDSCGATSVSFWSNVQTFRTNCSVIAAPWNEDFESSDWQPGTGFGVLGTIDTCFSRNHQSNFTMKAGPPQFVSTLSGPPGDHTTGSGKYLYSEMLLFSTAPITALIETPPIDLSSLTVPELTFWYHMFGTNVNRLEVFVSTDGGVNYSSVFVRNGQQQTAQSDPWKEAIVSLSSYSNDTVVLKFEVLQSTNGFNGDVSIDDVDIHEQPTCPKPSNLRVIASTATSVTLSWTSGGASNWQIEYGTPGFTAGSGNRVNAVTNPFTVTGLSANTTYDFYVRDSCSATDKSFWSTSVLGQTRCSPVTAPYTENFDASVWTRGPFTNSPGTINTCWQREELFYIFKSGPPQFVSTFTGSTFDHTTGNATGKYLQADRISFTTAQDTATITSVPIDVSALTIPELTFWYHMFGADIDRLLVLVSDDDGATFSQVHQIVGQHQTSNTDAWKEATVSLSAYANDTILVRFEGLHTNFGTSADICIDDFDIHEQPTCPKPSNLAVTSTGANSITLSWTTGGASNWQIEYGPPGFTIGSGTIVNASTNPFAVNGLSSSTTYDFYVRDSCSATDVSFWTGPVTGTTDCLPVAAPFSENFDGSSWMVGPLFNDTGSVAQCWNRTPLVTYFWKPGPPLFITTLTGPAADHTTGSGKFIYAESIFGGGTPPFDAFFETPLIDLSTLTVPELSFWYHMFGTNIGSLTVEIDSGSGYVQVWTKSGQQQTSGSAAWKEAIVNLSAYANDTIQIRFKATKASFGTLADAAIDDVDIHEAPSCPKPQNLVILGKTNSTVTLQWTSGGASDWNIEYGSPGFSLGSGTVVNATSNPFTVTGLLANTGYEFYVRDSCGVGDVSDWIGPVGDTTDCNPVAAPYLENFDGPNFVIGTFTVPGALDACWWRDETVNYQWSPQSTTTTFGTGPTADHTTGSGKFLHTQRTFGSVTQSMSGTVVSPLIDLAPLTTPEMSFWYHMFGADIDSLSVEIFDGSNWSHVLTLAGQQQTSKTDAWKEAIVNISTYANDTIKVRFVGHRNSTFAFNSIIAIDDLDIHEQPSCPKPSGLSVTATTANSVTLSWTTGGASNWQIEYGSSGYTPGSGTVVNATTNPFTVTGLNSSTTYDFYVRDSCGATDLSAWFGPATGATDCLPLLAPFNENFDGSTWTSGPNFNDTGTVAQCWVRSPLTNYFWRVGLPPFPSTITGPAADHTTGSDQFIFAESIFSGGTAPFDGYIESPWIDLTALTIPELSFWYHMFGTGVGSMSVEIDSGNGYNQIWTRTGEQQTSGTDAWKEAIVSLAAYANDTVRLRFKATKASFSTLADVAIDDVDIHEAPSCPKPQDLMIVGKTNSSVTLQWTTGGASNWNVEFGPVGFSPGSGTIVNAATNPFTVTGLSANTGYDFYVRDSCGVGDVSERIGPVGDTTDCNPVAAPYLETFDGPNFVIGTFTVPGALDACWFRDETVNYQWAPESTTTPFASGPTADHTSGSGKFLHTQRVFGTVTQSASGTVVSPLIDLVPLTTPEMSFWYHMFGADIDSLSVHVFDGSSWSHVHTIIGQQQTSKTDAWKEAIVNISAFANDTIKVRFVGHRNSTFAFNSVIAIDDLDIHEEPSCPKPSTLTAGTATATSISLSWVSGGASNWIIGYRTSGSSGALTFVTAVTNPFVVTGLNPSTSYDFYVKDSCGANDVSEWLGPLGASTLCGVATAPWSENFDGSSWVSGTGTTNIGNQINGCWSRPNANNPNFGTKSGPTSSTATGPTTDVSGNGNYLYTEASGASGTGEITTPYIYIPNSLQNPRFKFSYHMFGTNITSLTLKIDDGGGFGASVKTLTGAQHTSNNDPWKVDSVSLNSFKGDTIRVKFEGTNTGFNGDISIDEVMIISDPGAPNCADPSNVAFAGVTTNGFTISWTGNGNSTLEVVPAGQPQGSGTLYNNVTSPQVVNGLNSNTIYAIYLRDSCGATVFSDWITDSITTLACPPITPVFTYSSTWLSTTFNSISTVNADSIYWDFGDGNSSSNNNPLHNYLGAGTYIVTMLAYSDCGSTASLIDTIQICDTLTADFNFNQTGDTVLFDASISGNATAYHWDLSGVTDTTAMIFQYKFPTPGTKIVTLTVYNDCGDSVKVTKNVPVCLAPVAKWTYNIISTTSAGMKVQFDGSASQNAVTYEWDFGDGSPLVTGTVMPQHTYLTPGLFYKVTLKVTNTCSDASVSSFRLNQIGLEEILLNRSIQVYPNPADDRLNIEWDFTEAHFKSVEIMDATGKRVLYQTLESHQEGTTLDIERLSGGYYILRLTSDQGSVQRQFTVD